MHTPTARPGCLAPRGRFVALVLGASAVLSLALTAPPAHAADTPAVNSVADTLGVRVAAQPIREHAGWHAPRLILVSPQLHEELPQLRAAVPGVKLIEISQATPREIAAADATIGVCSPQVLTRAAKLQWIQWLGAGVETCVQQSQLRERHPLVTNMQRTAGPSMAEHVIAMMLFLSRHLDYFFRQQEQGNWAGGTPQLADLSGKTVLVVGLGGIGIEVAKRAHALGMRVIATRASGRTGPDYVSYVGLPEELLKLTKEADFVVNCAPLTPQTTGIFNQEFFAAMKPGAYFVNVGRGRSAVTADLIAALTTGKIAGAGLDVVDPEPLPPASPLWHLPNVIITPHISADTAVTSEQRAVLLRENLRRYAAGDPMLAVVDVERGY